MAGRLPLVQGHELGNAHLTTLQNNVVRALEQRMHRRGQPEKSFICEQDLLTVWEHPGTRFLNQLGELLQWTSHDYLNVRHRFLKTLSILVWIGWRDLLSFNHLYLSEHSQVADDSLPIQVQDYRILARYLPNDPASRGAFLEKQYIFLPIKICEGDDAVGSSSRYSQHHRIPSIASVEMSEGGARVVTKELIAADHIQRSNRLENHKETWVACKRIKGSGAPNSVNFDTESEDQRQFRMSLTNNKNILLSFAIIIRGTDLCIFSDLADCNLHQLLMGQSEDFSQYCSTVTPISLLQESQRLLGALEFLHKGLDTRSGRILCAHIDLQPENILVTWRNRGRGQSSAGLWQISDFGISQVKNPQPKTNQYTPSNYQAQPIPLGDMVAQVAEAETNSTEASQGSGDFQAPEVGGSLSRVVGQESNMWSFGCILTTVLAFASGGPAEVKRLYLARDHGDSDCFYKTRSMAGRMEQCVKPEVSAYLDNISPNEPWMSDSRNLVLDCLKTNSRFRPQAEDARLKLDMICGRVCSGNKLCAWISLFPISVESGLEAIHIEENTNDTYHSANIQPDHATEPSYQGPTSSDMSRSSSRSIQALQASATPPLLGATDTSPKPSLALQVVQRAPQERLRTVAGEKVFIKLERPPETRKSRLCPSAQRLLYVSETLLRIYDLTFLSEARKWEKERTFMPTRTIVAADIPSASQGSVALPQHSQLVATSIAGDFVAALLKLGKDRQHEARLYKLSNKAYSIDFTLHHTEPITGPVHDISVSSRGGLLVHLNTELKMLPPAGEYSSPGLARISPRSSMKSSISGNDRWISLQCTGEVQDAAFSHDGQWIYAWCRDQGLNYWYIWRALTGQIFIKGNSKFSSEGVHGSIPNFVIPFASSPFFLACDDRGILTMIGGYSSSGKCHRLRRNLRGVTAAAVTPEENAVVLVRKIQGQATKQELSILHLPPKLASCRLDDAQWSANGEVRELFRSSGALSVYRPSGVSPGVFILGSNPDGMLERRQIAS